MRTRQIFSSSNPVPSNSEMTTKHQSVLLHEAVEHLALKEGDVVIDATLGGAGHAKKIARVLGHGGLFIGFDLDSDAISRAEATLADAECRRFLINANFRD